MATHRYRFHGPTDDTLAQSLGEGEVVGNPVEPAQYVLRDLGTESLLTDLDTEMKRGGFVRSDDSLDVPPSLLQIQRSMLSADASAINNAAGWVDVRSFSISSEGSTVLELDAPCQFGVLIGGQVRLIINGGSMSNVVLRARDLAALAGNTDGDIRTYVELPSGSQLYTVSLQASASALGSVTPRAGCSLTAKEYSA